MWFSLDAENENHVLLIAAFRFGLGHLNLQGVIAGTLRVKDNEKPAA